MIAEAGSRNPPYNSRQNVPRVGKSIDLHIIFDINRIVNYEVKLLEPAVTFVQKLTLKMRAKVFRK